MALVCVRCYGRGMSAFILYPDPRLTVAATPRALDADLRAIGTLLLEQARAHQAYGLAAVHLGTIAPVIVVSLGPVETRDYRVMFNPKLLETSGASVLGTEGSVSLPGIEVDIARPNNAVVAYEDEHGAAQTLALDGFAARVAQHEIEQMNGTFFLSRLSRLKRDAALRRYQKRLRAEK